MTLFLTRTTLSRRRSQWTAPAMMIDARAALGVFVVLLCARTFTDTTLVSDSVSYFLNMGVAVLALIVTTGFTLVGRSGRGSGVLSLLALVAAGFGLLAIVLFGVQASLIGEYVRFASMLAMAVLVRMAVQGGISPIVVIHRALAASTPAILLLVVGYLGHVAFLFSSENGRVAGTFNQRNAAGAFVAVYLVTALWAAVATRRRTTWAQVVLAFIALIGTVSLGALAAAAAGTIVLLLFGLRRLPWFGRILLILAFLAGAYFLLTNAAIAARLDALNGNVTFNSALTASESTNSLQWRIINWRLLLQVWSQRPLFGWGFGSTASVIQPLGELPHNEYVRVLVETGIVGAVFALGLLVHVVVRLIRGPSRRSGGTLHVLGISVLATGLVDAIVANTISYPPTMYLLVGLVTAALGTPAAIAVRAARGELATGGRSTAGDTTHSG